MPKPSLPTSALRVLVPALLQIVGLAAAESPAPISIPVEMAYDGTLAISLNDAAGKPVRRLCSEERAATGQATRGWDLLDDAGAMVPPGTYRWTAITVPNLRLTYEGTVNNAGHPPWFAPIPGGGGWLADHSPGSSVCGVGETTFLGAFCAENGHAAMALDKDGNKAWGIGNMGGAFMGIERIASDGKCAYLANNVLISRVDPANGFAMQEVLRFAFTPDLPGPAGMYFGQHHNDIAVSGDRLFVAIDGQNVQLRGSAEASLLDFDLSQPPPAVRDSRDERDLTTYQRWQSALGMLNGPVSTTQGSLGPLLGEGDLQGTTTAVFREPVPVGSLLLSDPKAEVWMLRPDADLAAAGLGKSGPAMGVEDAGDATDPFSEDLWQPLRTVPAGTKTGPGPVLVAAEQPIRTRALRFKASAPLTFAVPLDRRFRDIAASAVVASEDGKAAPGGAWSVERDPSKMPISPSSQPAMVMVWPTAQKLRGLAMIEANEAYFAVDVWTGTSAPDAKTCAGQDTWREVGGFGAQMVGPAPQKPTFRFVDFGSEHTVTAVRVRATHPAGHRGYMGYEGLPVPGAHRASFSRIVAFQSLGGDLADLPPDLSQRIEEYRLTPQGPAELVRRTAVPHPGRMAVAADGTLFIQTNDAVATFEPETGKISTVIPAEKLKAPGGMAFDQAGNLVLTELGSNSVGIHSRDGAFLRHIGKAAKREVGAYDPLIFGTPRSVGVDHRGKIWIVDASGTPKRFTRWSADGSVLEQEFFGPAQYGGGGYIDPRDPSLVYYRGMKFRFDWKTRTSVLESLVYQAGEGPCLRTAEPDRPLYIGDRRYLIGDGGPVVAICIEKDGKALPVAAAVPLSAWGDIDADPGLRERYARLNSGALGFVWADRNGDRKPQADEVQLVDDHPLQLSGYPDVERIGDDLTLHFLDARLRPDGFTADGVPIYDVKNLEKGLPKGKSWGFADGTTLLVTGDGVRFTEADGKSTRWFYPDRFAGVHGSHETGYDRQPGMLVGTFHVVGHLSAGEKPEPLYVVGGNHGDWFAFTGDGILATCISGGPLTYGKRFWTTASYEPGKTDLSDLCLGEEHFTGAITRLADGRVMMNAGHNHNSLVRVDGLDQLRRITGTVTVTPDDAKKAEAFILQRQIAERARLGERRMRMPLSETSPIVVEGRLGDWNTSSFVTIEERWDPTEKRIKVLSSGGLAGDAEHLFIAGSVTDESPLLNSASDPILAFKKGDAFDVTIGLDPAAKPDRTVPVAGDVRILLVPLKERAVAVAYLPVVPGTPPDQRRVFAFTGRTEIDKAVVLDDAMVAFSRTPTGWTVEAAIPWSALGVEPPEPGHRLRADVGLLKSDQNGVATVMRAYWTAKTQTVVSDVGFEARLTPAIWGDLDTVAEEAPSIEEGAAPR